LQYPDMPAYWQPALGDTQHGQAGVDNQPGIPMTYAVDGRQYIAVAAGAKGLPGELITLTLPRPGRACPCLDGCEPSDSLPV
jgi:hypothetical protein